MHRFSVAANIAVKKLLTLFLAACLVLGSAAFAFASDSTVTTGSDTQQTTEEQSGEMDEETRKKRIEIYSIGAMIALGAMIVGRRDNRNRRR